MKQLRRAEGLLTDERTSMAVLANLRLSTKHLMENIRTLEQNVNNVATRLQDRIDSKEALNAVRKAIHELPKEEKSYAKARQEWDMKKLYAEVLKMSYRRNDLKTPIQKVT